VGVEGGDQPGAAARLLERHGRGKEAREPLGKIYASLTEGFDTGDLLEAKALLARL
jgi:predicted ATPase